MEERRQSPVFVKLDDYKEVLEVVEMIRQKIVEARSVLDKIHNLKTEEDSEVEMWKSELDDVEKRIQMIDRSLLEPRGV